MRAPAHPIDIWFSISMTLARCRNFPCWSVNPTSSSSMADSSENAFPGTRNFGIVLTSSSSLRPVSFVFADS